MPARVSRGRAPSTLVAVAVYSGRGRELQDLACSCFPSRVPRAVGVRVLKNVVDVVAECVVIALKTDTVGLFGEGVAQNFELASVLIGKSSQDHVVSGDSDNLAATKRLKAGGVSVGRDEVDVVLSDVLL